MNAARSHIVRASIQGTLWSYASVYSGKLVVFFSTLILARVLIKEDFGLAGYALVFISFLDVLNDLGIGAAVIYYRDDARVLNTAFWLNVLAGIALFGLTWAAAPLAGAFFDDLRAVPLTRVMALTFPLTAVGNIHASLLRKNLSFKRKAVPDFIKSLGKGTLSVVLAWQGFGAWSLVIGQVGGVGLAAVVLWIASPWRPQFTFARDSVKQLLAYGSNIVAGDALGTLINQADYLIVGRVLGAVALGSYTLAFRIPELLVKQFCLIVGRVMFPSYSKIKKEEGKLGQSFLVTMRYLTLITVPVSLGLAVIARPLVLLFFTEKWAEIIPIMIAISLYTLIRSLTFNIGGVYKAQGRPDLLLKLSLAKVPLLLPALWWAANSPGGLITVAWTQVVLALIFGVINLTVASRMLATPFWEILKAFLPSLFAGLIMVAAVMGVLQLTAPLALLVQLISGTLIGMIVYGLVLLIFQKEVIRQAQAGLKTTFARA